MDYLQGWDTQPDQGPGLVGRLTARGSAMVDSWFGLGTSEQLALDGPSLLERKLAEASAPPSSSFAFDTPSALPMWDIDFGFEPTPLPSTVGGGGPPALPPRSLRYNDADRLSLVAGAGASIGSTASSLDYEMDTFPPSLPPRDLRPLSTHDPHLRHEIFADVSDESSDDEVVDYQRDNRGKLNNNNNNNDNNHNMEASDFWSDSSPAPAPALVQARPQARGRGKGTPMLPGDSPRPGRRQAQARGSATIRHITPNATLPQPNAKKQQVAKPKYWPVFILLVTAADIAGLILELAWNGGVEDFQDNPFFGPTSETLKTLGAKWTLAILEQNEAWRFFTAMFLHVGIVHLLINITVQLRVGWTLERQIGFWRIGPIYILSGFAGNLASCIFLPNTITVGASGAAFGLAGVLVADLILNWGIVQRPYLNALFLLVGLGLALAVGLLPGLDNFAHIGGLVQGFLAGLVLLPSLAARVKHCYRLLRWLIILLVPPINALLLAIGLVVLYYNVNPNDATWCDVCATIDCIPVLSWCNYGSA